MTNEKDAITQELFLLLRDIEAGCDRIQSGLAECLAIAKDTSAMLAERRSRPGSTLDSFLGDV